MPADTATPSSQRCNVFAMVADISRLGIRRWSPLRRLHSSCMAYTKLSATGRGAEAAIGQLTRLTSLHMSIDRTQRPPYQNMPPEERRHALRRLARQRSMLTAVPLQLQQLGCSGAPRGAGGSQRNSSSGSGSRGLAAGSTARNTGLQELTLDCKGHLLDVELAAAAGAVPDLRRLKVSGSGSVDERVVGLYGARLAAFSAYRRLREISLWHGPHMNARQLVRQLPRIGSLASLQVRDCPLLVQGDALVQLQAAFQAEHGRQLLVTIVSIC